MIEEGRFHFPTIEVNCLTCIYFLNLERIPQVGAADGDGAFEKLGNPGGPYTVSPTSAVIKERLPKSPGNPKMWSPWRWVMKIW